MVFIDLEKAYGRVLRQLVCILNKKKYANGYTRSYKSCTRGSNEHENHVWAMSKFPVGVGWHQGSL